jgi:hypothetical protein
LSDRDRKAIRKRIGRKAGSCRASWKDNPGGGFEFVIGKGNRIELDAKGEAWEHVEVEGPVKPAIMAEPDVLRALLHDLRVKVTLFWKPKTGRFFEIDRRRLQAEINGNVVDVRNVTRGPVTSISA